MEKTISQEERIRRAEEIYNRRKNSYERNYKNRYISSYRDKDDLDLKSKVIKKTVYQIIICMLIYLALYGLKNSELIFNKDINEKINSVLSYDINVEEIYKSAKEYLSSNKDLNNFFSGLVKNDDKKEDKQEVETENKIDENKEKESKNEANTIGIGGAEELANVNEQVEESDVDYIKKHYSIIWPLNGVITSKFGAREPTEIVSANHKGLDIGGNIGDSIIAGMDGTVTVVSEEGDYGKHIEIVNGDVLTLYAHCSALLVSEGEEVKQGQVIAEVGETGRATGPHLHFEIRRNDVAIDPELVL